MARAREGDLVFCHQTELGGIVGLTIAASGGYPDPEGKRADRYSMIDLGPQRIRFDSIVKIRDIRRHVGHLGAHQDGRSQSTFHDVEPRFVQRLLKLCAKLNPHQRATIRRISHESLRVRRAEQAARACALPQAGVLKDPIRREIHTEAFERRASWAKAARRTYGCRCMMKYCDFALETDGGDLYIEVHHLRPMCEGGSPNDLRNMCVVCPNHHRACHYGSTELRRKLERQIRERQAAILRRTRALR